MWYNIQHFDRFDSGQQKKQESVWHLSSTPPHPFTKKRERNRQKCTQCSTCHFQCERLTVTTGFSFFEFICMRNEHKSGVIVGNTEIVRNNFSYPSIDMINKFCQPNLIHFFLFRLSPAIIIIIMKVKHWFFEPNVSNAQGLVFSYSLLCCSVGTFNSRNWLPGNATPCHLPNELDFTENCSRRASSDPIKSSTK